MINSYRIIKICFIIAVFTALFICCDDESQGSTLPKVKTIEATDITTTTVFCKGKILSNGNDKILARGFVYSTVNNLPTTDDETKNTSLINDEFKIQLSGLSSGTIYYIRAFATNNVGTSYGDPITFETEAATVTFMYNGSEVTYGIKISPLTGRKWLDRNLGAAGLPVSRDDVANAGDLFQWGRQADGHQLINRSVYPSEGINESILGPYDTDTPNTNLFVVVPSYDPGDWRVPQKNNLWKQPDLNNNPCPAGWHVPTQPEWEAERLDSLQEAWGRLNLTRGGIRSKGGFVGSEQAGYYWSSTSNAKRGQTLLTSYMQLNESALSGSSSIERVHGLSVRCISND
jgi:hypothetical protein